MELVLSGHRILQIFLPEYRRTKISFKNLNAYLNVYLNDVVLEIYLDYKFQWPQEGLNCESLA